MRRTRKYLRKEMSKRGLKFIVLVLSLIIFVSFPIFIFVFMFQQLFLFLVFFFLKTIGWPTFAWCRRRQKLFCLWVFKDRVHLPCKKPCQCRSRVEGSTFFGSPLHWLCASATIQQFGNIFACNDSSLELTSFFYPVLVITCLFHALA